MRMTDHRPRYLFVYGTLMSGAPAARSARSSACGSRARATASAPPRIAHARLYDLGRYPGGDCRRRRGRHRARRGGAALRSAADARLARRLRGHVHGGATRTNTIASCCEVRLAGGETFDAWVYLLRRVPARDARASTAAAGSARSTSRRARTYRRDVESWPADPERPSSRAGTVPASTGRPAPTTTVIHPPPCGHYFSAQKHIFMCITRRCYLRDDSARTRSGFTPRVASDSVGVARARRLRSAASHASSASLRRLTSCPRSMPALCAAAAIARIELRIGEQRVEAARSRRRASRPSSPPPASPSSAARGSRAGRPRRAAGRRARCAPHRALAPLPCARVPAPRSASSSAR